MTQTLQCLCGHQYPTDYPHCPACGLKADHAKSGVAGGGARSRSIYIVLALLLGGLGIHNFYAGHQARGLGQMALSMAGVILSPLFWLGAFIWIILDIVTVTADGEGRVMS